MKLGLKFFIFFAVLLTITLGATGYFAGKAVNKAMIEQLSMRLSGEITALDQPFKSAFVSGREDAMLAALQRLQRHSGALYAAAITRDGLVLAHTNVAKSGERLSDPATLKALKSGKSSLMRTVYRSEQALEVTTPFNWAGDLSGEDLLMQGGAPAAPMGAIRVAMPLAAAIRAEREIVIRLFLMIFAVYLVSLAIAALFLQAIRKQVRLLEETIAAGTAGLASSGKSGPLAGILNAMREKLFAAAAPANLISVRKSAEALHKSEQLLAATLRSISDGVIACDAEGRVVSLNAMAETLTGWTGDVARGRPIAEIFRVVHPMTRLQAEVPVGRALREDRIIALANHTSLIARDGAERQISDSCAPIHDAAGAVIGAVLIFRDVSEAYFRSEQLRLANIYNRSLIEASPDPLVTIGSDGRITDANAALAAIAGIPKDRIIGTDFSNYFTDPKQAKAVYERVFREGKVLDYPLNFVGRDGCVTPVLYNATLYRDENGKTLGVLATARDITERKQAERERDKLNAALLEKNREMESFLYLTTHDLRGPLVNIQGFSQNLERYVNELRAALAPAGLPPEAGETLDKLAGNSIPRALLFVQENARKMDSLITALLKVARVGRVQMKPETVEMNELLRKILFSLRYQLEESGGAIKCGSLPPCRADPDAVSQIFTNLLDNAVKYRHKDRRPAINVTGEAGGAMVVYKVADNGAGVPESNLLNIWNVFYQSARTTGKKGEGIGLHMVKRMAEKNGGGIRVESRENEGTVFYVELPAAG